MADGAALEAAGLCRACGCWAVQYGVCEACSAEFCERCGYVEVTDRAACCERCSPVYVVATINRPYYIGRHLRRAFEAQSYLHHLGLIDAVVTVPVRVDLDSDGLSDREGELLMRWWWCADATHEAVHTCIAPDDHEMLRRMTRPEPRDYVEAD